MALAASMLLGAGQAYAVDYSLSGFGTIQYTTGDNQKNYLRFANEEGTLKVNSILGGQLDVKLNQQFSATVQYVISPKQDDDEGVELDNRWAFLSWKPNDNLQFKLGRQRINFYLDSENLDVGQTYVPANLSPEIYYNPGVLGTDGFSATYSFEDRAGRYWSFQGILGNRDVVQRSGPTTDGDFPTNKLNLKGFAITLDANDYRVHLSHHEADVFRAIEGKVMGIPAKGRNEGVAHFTNVGAEKDLGKYTLRAELSQLELESVVTLTAPIQGVFFREPEFEEHAGNVMLTRHLNNGHAVYGSMGRFISGFEDQHSIALGGRYLLSPSQSIKAELMQVHEKRNRRQLSDNRIPDTTFHMLSVSYNWVWQ